MTNGTKARRRPLKVGSGLADHYRILGHVCDRRPLKVGSGRSHRRSQEVARNRSPSPQGRVGTRRLARALAEAFDVAVPSRSGRNNATHRTQHRITPCRRPLKVGSGLQRVSGADVSEQIAVPSRSGRDWGGHRVEGDFHEIAVPSRSGRDLSHLPQSTPHVRIAVPSRSGRDDIVDDKPQLGLRNRRPLKVGSGLRQNLGFWWRYGSKGVDGCSRPSVG
mgnify:CR=1 FL=1